MLLWLKALHIIAVIAWMSGILYFWRLLVYHAMATEAAVIDQLQRMQGQLRSFIMNPAMIATFVFGIGVIAAVPEPMQYLKTQHWLHAKLLLVLFLAGNHGMAVSASKKLAQNPRAYGEKYLRLMNEVPTVLMILIVILAVVRPF